MNPWDAIALIGGVYALVAVLVIAAASVHYVFWGKPGAIAEARLERLVRRGQLHSWIGLGLVVLGSVAGLLAGAR